MDSLTAFHRLMKISCLLLCCLFSRSVLAQSVWTGAVSTNWHDPANWSGNQVPTNQDDVIIPLGRPVANIDQTAFARNITINGSVRAVGGIIRVSNDLIINNGGLLDLGTDSNVVQTLIQIQNRWVNNGGNTAFRPGRGLIEFTGRNNNQMSYANNGEQGTFWGLSMLAERGELNLQDSLMITGRLYLYNGWINSNLTALMTLAENMGDIVGGERESHIIGPVRVLTRANYNRLIPVGNLNGYSPFGMSGIGATPAAFLVSYRHNNPGDQGYATTAIKSETEELCFVDGIEYWAIRRLSAQPAAVKVTLYYNNLSNFRSPSMGKVAYWDQDGAGMAFRSLGGSVQNTLTFGAFFHGGFAVADFSITPTLTERALAFGYKSPLLAPVMSDDSSCAALGSSASNRSSSLNIQFTTLRFFAKRYDATPIWVGTSFLGSSVKRDTIWAEIVLGNCVSPRAPFIIKPMPTPRVGHFPDSLILCDTGYVVNLTPRNTFNPLKRRLEYSFKLRTAAQLNTLNYTEYIKTDSTLLLTYKETTYITISTRDQINGCLSDSSRSVVIKVKPLPKDPKPQDVVSCDTATLTVRVDSNDVAGEYYRWFTTETGPDTLAGIQGSQYTALFNQTTSFFVSKYIKGTGCESKRTEVKAIIAGYPQRPALRTINPICIGRTATISLVTTADSIYLFADSLQTQILKVSSGVNITTPALNSNTTYWVGIGNQYGCRSKATTRAVVNVSVTPQAPAVTDTTLCRASVVTLRATRPNAGGTLHWFRDSTGGSAITVGDTFRTSIASNESFFVEYRNGSGCTSVRSKLRVNLIPFISQPTSTGKIACLGEPTVLRAYGAQGSQQYRWYQDLTSTTPIGFLDSLVLPSVTASRIYYVALTESGCQSNLLPVIVVVEPTLPRPQVQHDTICTGQQAQLNAYADDALNYKLYDALTGGNFVSQAADGRFNTSPLTADVTYYVSAISRAGCESPRAAISAIIRNPDQPPVARDTTLCGPGTANLSASGLPVSSNYVLYNAAVGGFALQQSQDGRFSVPVTSTTTYYVAGVSNASCFTPRVPLTVTVQPGVSTPTATNFNRCGTGMTTFKVGNWQPGLEVIWYAGTQVIDTTAADSIRLNITGDTTIKAALTNGTCASNKVDISVLVQPAVITPILPADTAICSSQSQLVIIARGAKPGQVYNWYANATAQGFPILSDASGRLPLTNPVVGTAYSVIISGGPACNSAPASIRILARSPLTEPFERAYNYCTPSAANITVSSPTGYPAGTQYLVYDTTTSTTPRFIANDSLINLPLTSSSRSFYISVASPDGCESPRVRYTINISQLIAPSVIVPDTICGNNPLRIRILSPIGAAVYYVFDSPTSSTPVMQTSADDFTLSNPRTGIYYISYDLNGSGCLSPRTPVSLAVFSQPTATVNVPSQLNYCLGSSFVIIKVSGATGGERYAWFDNNLPNARPFMVTAADSLILPNPSTRTLFVALTGGGSCNGPLSTISLFQTNSIQAPIARDTSVCQLGPIGLFARSLSPNVDYFWYNSATSTTALGSSQDGRFNINLIGQDTIYVAARTRGTTLSCESGRTRIIINYSPLGLLPPTAGAGAGCANIPGRLVVTAPLFTNQYALYNSPNASTPLLTSTNGIFSVTALSARTFYASYSISGCESQRIPVSYTIWPDAPRAKPLSDTVRLCSGFSNGSVTLSLVPDTGTVTYNFYQDTLRAPVVTSSTPSADVPINSFPATIYAEIVKLNTCRTTKVPIVLFNNRTVMPAPVISDTVLCANTTSVISILNTYDYPVGTIFQFIDVTGGGSNQLQNWTQSTLQLNPFQDLDLRIQAFLPGICQSLPVVYRIRTTNANIIFPPVIPDLAVCGGDTATLRLNSYSPDGIYEVRQQGVGNTIGRAVNGVIRFRVISVPGAYRYDLVGTKQGCQGSTYEQDFNVVVYNKPAPPVISSNYQVLCPQDRLNVTVSFPPTGFNVRWFRKDGSTIQENSFRTISYVVQPTDTLFVQYTSMVAGCASEPTPVNFGLRPGPVVLTPDTSTCEQVITLRARDNGTGPKLYQWLDGNQLLGTDSTIRIGVGNGRNIRLAIRTQDPCSLAVKTIRITNSTTIAQPVDSINNICGSTSGVTIGTRAASPNDTSFIWFDSRTSTTPIDTTNVPRLLISSATNRSYFVSSRRGNCLSSRAEVTVRIRQQNPSPAIANNGVFEVCNINSTANVSVGNYSNNGLFVYANINDQSPRFVSNTSTVQVTVTSLPQTFYLAQGDACQSPRLPFTIVGAPLPNPPTGPDSVLVCANSGLVLNLTPAIVQPVQLAGYNWYSVSGGARGLLTTTLTPSFSIGSTSLGDSIFVAAISTRGCEGPFKKIKVSLSGAGTPLTLAEIGGYQASYCSGDSAALSILNPVAGVIYEWFRVNTFVGRGIRYTFRNLGLVTDISVRKMVGSCNSAPLRITLINETGPRITGFNHPTVCLAGRIGVQIFTSASGGRIEIWSSPTGGTLIDTARNNTFMTPLISRTTTYYAVINRRNSPCQSIRVPITVTFTQSVQAQLPRDTAVCSGVSIYIQARNGVTSQASTWRVIAGNNGFFPSTGNNWANFRGQVGTYVIVYTIWSSGNCPSTSDTMVVNYGVDNSNFNVNYAQNYCSSEPVILQAQTYSQGRYLWFDGTGRQLSESTSTLNLGILPAGTYQYQAQHLDGRCLSRTVTINFRVNNLGVEIFAGNDTSLCTTVSTRLNARPLPSGYSGFWTIISGRSGILADRFNPRTGFTGTEGETYLLRWRVSPSPCNITEDFVLVSIQTTSRPPIVLRNIYETCNTQPITLVASGGANMRYRWYLRNASGGLDSLTTNSSGLYTVNPPTTITDPVRLTYAVSSVSGVCQSLPVDISVTIYPPPAISLGPDQVVPFNKRHEITVNATQSMTYAWFVLEKPAQSFFSPTQNTSGSLQIPTDIYGLYRIRVRGVSAQGCEANDTINIRIAEDLRIFNAFTPNRDGSNEVWNLPNWQLYPDMKVIIYNKWNEVVYESAQGYNTPWDGTRNGQALPAGGYIYQITRRPGEEPLTGTVTLIR